MGSLTVVDYGLVIRKTEGIVGDKRTQSLAAKHGLQVLNVTWEDTGRYKESAVGPIATSMVTRTPIIWHGAN